MSFEEALATQPVWLQWWGNAMGLVLVGSTAVLALSKETRRDALVILVTSLAVYGLMMWLYQQVGFVCLSSSKAASPT